MPLCKVRLVTRLSKEEPLLQNLQMPNRQTLLSHQMQNLQTLQNHQMLNLLMLSLLMLPSHLMLSLLMHPSHQMPNLPTLNHQMHQNHLMVPKMEIFQYVVQFLAK
jgi:hypothetical protein